MNRLTPRISQASAVRVCQLYDKPHRYLTWRNPWEWTKWIAAIGLLALFFPIGFAAFFEINKEYDAILRRCYAEVEDSLRRQGKLKE